MNYDALPLFVATMYEINARLDELKALDDEHMGFSPDDINWGHVAEARYFLESLREIPNSIMCDSDTSDE